MLVPHRLRNMIRPDIPHNQPNIRVRRRPRPGPGVLHRDAHLRGTALRVRRAEVDVGGGLEAGRVEVGLAGVDLCVGGEEAAEVAVGGVDADGDAGLAGGGRDAEGVAGRDEGVEHGDAVGDGRREGFERDESVVLLLREERLGLGAGEAHRRDGFEAEALAPGLDDDHDFGVLVARLADDLDGGEALGLPRLVGVLEHELEGAAAVDAAELLHDVLRGRLLEKVRRELDVRHLHRGRLGVAKRAVEVEEDSGVFGHGGRGFWVLVGVF
mmetsp:Transcript_28322/g.71050  ORF Transcript_28322/g.71050 Transcript_28322/m.71050 type:complete len:269 (+) Transcript_28322:358-1164(+)